MKFLVNRKIMHTYNLALDAWGQSTENGLKMVGCLHTTA